MPHDLLDGFHAGQMPHIIQMGVQNAQRPSAFQLHKYRFRAGSGARAVGILAAGLERRFRQPESAHLHQVILVFPEGNGHLLPVQASVPAASNHIVVRQILLQPRRHVHHHFLKTDDIRLFFPDGAQDQGLTVYELIASIPFNITPNIKRDILEHAFPSHFCLFPLI